MNNINESIEVNRQRAVLACADTGEWDAGQSLDELEALAQAAGASVVLRVAQKRDAIEAATVLGSGTINEIADFCREGGADLIIFDRELSPSQTRNISKLCGVGVIDRTTLILDIFAQRAVTAEGRLQVELAQLQYRLPRLAGIGTELSRLGGGIGTRGPGETRLESDRRHIRRRIDTLRSRLAVLEKRRGLQNERRKKTDTQTVAIIGYTNVGKSTLLNTLTGAGVLARDQLFATLDPVTRALTLPDGRTVLLVDTVGLIRRLPHNLVEAFHSTLEQGALADLVWCVCDATDDAEAQLEVAKGVLNDMGACDTPVIAVVNKCDLRDGQTVALGQDTVCISARTGQGLDKLLEKTAAALVRVHRRMKLLVPYANGGFVEALTRDGTVFTREYQADGILVDALVHWRMMQEASLYETR